MARLRVNKPIDPDDLVSKTTSAEDRDVLDESAFKRRIVIERKRTERSKEPFLLMLLGSNEHSSAGRDRPLAKVISALAQVTRETDVLGWYSAQTTIGVMFTGLAPSSKSATLGTVLARVSEEIRGELTLEQFSQLRIEFYLFPDDWDQGRPGGPSTPALYPDVYAPSDRKSVLLGVKRIMDVAGAALFLLSFLPLFLVIAALIKVTSGGPVMFKQERVGQYGQRFTFLKFRSMYANNDHSTHREYVKQLIAGCAEKIPANGNGDGVYKLANDRRITPVGKLLRRTSLDELPQFLNVLRGDMSLVGPRPPIPYELAAYQTWHRRRLLNVKPGITGLWQVTGRSRVTFDDMVRLDLHYASSWSPWVDLKILLRTPAAVIRGAY